MVVRTNDGKQSIDSSTAQALRQAFADSGKSIKRLSVESGIAYASCHGLICGTRDLHVSTADKLAAALGFRLVLRPIRRKRKA